MSARTAIFACIKAGVEAVTLDTVAGIGGAPVATHVRILDERALDEVPPGACTRAGELLEVGGGWNRTYATAPDLHSLDLLLSVDYLIGARYGAVQAVAQSDAALLDRGLQRSTGSGYLAIRAALVTAGSSADALQSLLTGETAFVRLAGTDDATRGNARLRMTMPLHVLYRDI